MRNQFVIFLTVLFALISPVAAVTAQDASPSASPVAGGGGLDSAVQWVTAQQLENGSFAGLSGEPDAGTTIDVVVALVAARNQGVDTGTAIEDAVAWLGSEDIALVYEQVGVGQAAKLVLALVAVGEDPTDFVGTNPLGIVQHGMNAETGIFGAGIYDHAYALMAYAVTGTGIPTEAIDALVATQTENGGWAWDGSTDPAMADSNSTAMVVQALVAGGHADHELVTTAMAFLAANVTDAGATYAPGADVDGNSTALVAQAYIATGQDASALSGALHGFQNTSGAYFYQATDTTDNLFTTAQVIPAAAGQALPILPVEAEATPMALAA